MNSDTDALLKDIIRLLNWIAVDLKILVEQGKKEKKTK